MPARSRLEPDFNPTSSQGTFMKMLKPLVAIAVAAILTAGCTTTPNTVTESSLDAQRVSLDANVQSALASLSTQVPGSRDLVRKARGVLVFPSVVSAGLVIGGSHGRGALLTNGVTAGYYTSTAVSVGLLAGAESKAVYVLFMTEDSLDKFRASKGWTAGADASVTLLKVGADGAIDTQTVQAPIVGFALTNGGLMANLSIDGSKFSKIDF
jgi:lipid-binding SYLF domain-containing protein